MGKNAYFAKAVENPSPTARDFANCTSPVIPGPKGRVFNPPQIQVLTRLDTRSTDLGVFNGNSGVLPDMARYNQIWPDMARYCQIWPDMFRYSQIWSDMARYSQIWLDMARYAQIWPDMFRYSQIWQDIARYG